jgi:CRP/FNR family cyclic AMP-dependent transcriptional regulator
MPLSVDLLRQVSYLEDQSQAVLEALAAVASPLTFAAGEIIFLQEEPSLGLYVVESGEVKISRLSRDGRELILHLIHAGESFNDIAALDGGPNPATATAGTACLIWLIRRSDLRQVTMQHPGLAWALIQSAARRARYLLGLVEDLGMRSVRGRLARLLLAEARAYEADAIPRLLTQEEMAARLGTVREVVGRALRSLAADGIIAFDRHRIVILDPQRLASEAEM